MYAKIFFLLLFWLLSSCSSIDKVNQDLEKEKNLPNIIVIMADDLGYGDLSCYGATRVKTPNIDKLAEKGLKFTSGYASASTCTPTRYSFLTGTYAFRKKGTGIAPPNSPALLPAGIPTIASLLKKKGYRTAVIGKWHLGLGQQNGPNWNGKLTPGPLEIGFDYCYLLPTTNDRVPQVYVENHYVKNLIKTDPLWVGNKKPYSNHKTGISHRQELKMDWAHGHNGTIHNGISRIGFYTGGHKARFRDEDLADEWVKQSNRWIEKNKENPFFLFFSSHDLHVPRMPHERFQGQSQLGFRGDAIVQLDWSVGAIIKNLKRLNLIENTLIVFCSDNGPVLNDGYKDGAVEKNHNHRAAGDYSGGKYTVFEGGTRTPFITYWQGKIEAGVSEEIVSTIDLAASFANLIGVEMEPDAYLDSYNIIDVLLGKNSAKGREYIIQQDNGRQNNYGIRMGDWKLVSIAKELKKNWWVKLGLIKVPNLKTGIQLFDLKSDLGEKIDVSHLYPDVVKKLKGKLQQVINAGRSRNTVANETENMSK